jgi:transposase
MENLRGDLLVMKTLNIKPNFSELARTYNLDYRTIKKRYDGVENKKVGRKEESFWDKYRQDIEDLLSQKGITKKAIYQWIKMNKGDVLSYQSFTSYIRRNEEHLCKTQVKANVRFETKYGKQMQFDWKGPITMHTIDNEEITFYIFGATLGASRFHKFIYSRLMTREDVQNCLITTFKSIGGVPEECLTDNMTSIVNYSKNDFSEEFKAFAKDIGFIPKRCHIFSPQTKGKVESSNRYVNWLKPYENKFKNENELIDIINKVNVEVNKEINQTTKIAPVLLFSKEKEYLKPLPSNRVMKYYEGTEVAAKVPNTLLVYFKGSGYSVPSKYIGKTVKLKVYDNNLYIYYNTDLISMHEINNKKFNYREIDYIDGLKTHLDAGKYDIETMAKSNLALLDKITK